MECKKFNDGTTCNGCNYNLLSKEFIQGKDIIKVSKVAANILWVKNIKISANKSDTIYNLNIKCNNSISIHSKDINSNTFSIYAIQEAYCKLIINWYNYYSIYKSYNSYKYIKERLRYINKCQYIHKIRIEGISITKYLEEIMICNQNCNVITPDKEISKCNISLLDMKKILKLNPDGLVSVLNTILYTAKDISTSNLTIDLTTSYVTCSGNIIMNSNFVPCKSTAADMESIYIYYLNSWCNANANTNRQNQVYKIRNSVSRIKQTKTVQEIYDISCELLDSLW